VNGSDGPPEVRASVERGVATLVVDNPSRANAMTRAMLEAVPGLLRDVGRDDRACVLVVRGAGERAFVSGADVAELAASRATADAARASDAVLDGFWAAWLEFPKPIVALVRGACVGGGLLLALLADIRIAGGSSRFAAAAAGIGAGLPVWAVDALRAAVGPAFAMELLLSAQWVDADRAVGMGLVNHVVADDALDQSASALAAAIAAVRGSGGTQLGSRVGGRGLVGG
jgi:enoyl-CoA hydratase/carnithine racemase